MTKKEIDAAVTEFREAREAYKVAQAGYEDTSVEITLAKRGKSDITLEEATAAQRAYTSGTWVPAYNRKNVAARAVLEALGLDADERASFKGALR